MAYVYLKYIDVSIRGTGLAWPATHQSADGYLSTFSTWWEAKFIIGSPGGFSVSSIITFSLCNSYDWMMYDVQKHYLSAAQLEGWLQVSTCALNVALVAEPLEDEMNL